MSFPDKAQRKTCWDARDRYWECLDDENIKDSSLIPKVCAEFRRAFEKSCPSKWVTHFDRKRDFNVFKEKMQKEGLAIMDNLKEHLLKITMNTNVIKIGDIQDVFKIIQKLRNTYGCNSEYIKYCNEILGILWNNLERGFTEFDDQLLCSTYFYSILMFSNEKDTYFKKVLILLNYELDIKEKGMEASNTMFNTISLVYGIFQSSILQENSENQILETILEKLFALLILMTYEYSQYTFITFKIMTFFKKAAGTTFQNVIFNEDHNLKILNVINHNWENPITGVRALNKIVFHNLISVADESLYEYIEQKLSSFYWNKAKYLMFAEVIDISRNNIKVLLHSYDIVKGLVYSLSKTGLVSAGTDMYIAILKKLNTEEEWCATFLPSIIKIIEGLSTKPIDNFNNYWCLNTLKKFPSLSHTIFDEIIKLDGAEHQLISCLRIMDQSNKLGLLEKHFTNCNDLEKIVLDNMDHNEEQIRIVSFSIICGLHNNFLPEQKKYDLILDFLQNNINSDSPILRIHMTKSFQNFLIQQHMTFANNIKNCKNNDIEQLTLFCEKLQKFIIQSLEFDGNYQRKIATIQITKTMFAIFKEIPRKKQKGGIQQQTNLLSFLKTCNKWILSEKHVLFKFISLLKDPSDDIREHVKDVLLNNYSMQLSETEIMTYLTEEAISCMKSRFFYQITCGQTIFKLILNILLIENGVEGRFKKVEDIFDFAYNEIQFEFNSNLDIVKSIVEGKQLHSYLNILHSVFEVSLEKSYELNISVCIITSLIELLQNISNQFVWEQECGSSDFSQMNDMIQNLIASSQYKVCNQFNETNISGLHQIVLNCLWLNVKTSCELSSILVRYYKTDRNHDICEKCLKLICNVLETSRHKGAIEAGGTALGQAIQELTSLPASSVLSTIPMSLLKQKFKQLVLETSNMTSVTRRGAGLSIMIHRIVSSDMKKGKPLFHYFMQILLETCNNQPIDNNYVGEHDIDNEKDLPQAIYIHFLTKIVTDSSLACDVMYYSGKLAKLAFDNLASPCWQIRNAALQLYGSLIPKIIGQKKNSGASEEVMATVAVDEFRTHSPKLWEYMETQLKIRSRSHDLIESHNNLVPILSILANLAPFYDFSNEMSSKKNLLPHLILLLGSPIYVVRRLTSKCILNIYPCDEILHFLMDCTCDTENSLHGTLVLLNDFNKHYKIKNMYEDKANIIQNKFNTLIVTRKCSYLSREQYERVFPESINLTDIMVEETLSELYSNANSPGFFLWANFRIQLYLENVPWNRIPNIISLISNCCNFETYCETLCKRIEGERFINENILLELSSYLYPLGFKRKSTIIWRTLYAISLHTESLTDHLETSLLHQYFTDNKEFYRVRYMIAFAARILNVGGKEQFLYLSNIILKLCLPETDLDLRLIAATANNELASKFIHLSDGIRINAIEAAVMFLQDEDEDIRKLSVQFYRKVNMDKMARHPYICLRKMLNKHFLYNVLDDPHTGVQSICNDLLDRLQSINIHNDDEYNPFANDSKNVYLEPKVLKMVLCDLNIP